MGMFSIKKYKFLVYVSRKSDELSNDMVSDIISKAVINNAKNDITGILLVKKDYFYQFIEGTEQAVDALYAKLQHDRRHHDLNVLMTGYENKRVFPIWDMHPIYSHTPDQQLYDFVKQCQIPEVKDSLQQFCINYKPLIEAYH